MWSHNDPFIRGPPYTPKATEVTNKHTEIEDGNLLETIAERGVEHQTERDRKPGRRGGSIEPGDRLQVYIACSSSTSAGARLRIGVTLLHAKMMCFVYKSGNASSAPPQKRRPMRLPGAL